MSEDETIEIKKSELEQLIEQKVEEKVKNIKQKQSSQKNTSEGLNRRQFLKKAGLGLGGLAALTLPTNALDVRDDSFNVYTTSSEVEALSVDGSQNVSIPNGSLSVSGSISGSLSSSDLDNNSLTVAGNSVSLGSSTGISHADLSNISSNDHHSRYADSEARSAVESGNLSRIDGANGHRIRFDSSSSWIEVTDHSNNRHDVVLGDVFVDDLSGGTWLGDLSHGHLSGISSDDHHSRYTDSEAQSAVGIGGYVDNRSGSRIGVPTYSSESDLPSGNEGDIAYVQDEEQLYVFTG